MTLESGLWTLDLGPLPQDFGKCPVLAPSSAGSFVAPFHLATLGFGLGTCGEVLFAESTPPDYHCPGSVGYSQCYRKEGT